MREPQLAGVVRLPVCQHVRAASLARVLRHPHRRRPDRHLAALQIPGARARRAKAAQPRDDARHCALRGGAGALHAVV